MGYNSKCTDQSCTQNCCNIYGNCPSTTSYSSSLTSTCKYYYSDSQSLEGGPLAGIIVGAFVGFIVLIVVIVHCCVKKCRERMIAEKMAAGNQAQANKQNGQYNMTTQHLATQYTDPNQIMLQNQPPYGQYGQPVYGQYAQGYPQPPMMPNTMVQPPIMGQPVQQALFGQGPSPYPVVQGYQGYGPGPIVR